MRRNIKSLEKPFTHAEVVALAERLLRRFGGDRNKAGRYARAMEDRHESAKWAQVVEVIATSGSHHATMKTSAAQLDREVAEALETAATPARRERYRQSRRWGLPAYLSFKVATGRPLEGARSPWRPRR